MSVPRRLTWLLASGWMLLLGCKTAAPSGPTSGAVAAEASVPEASKLFADGIAAFDAGNLSNARKLFGQALSKNPKMVKAQYNLGLVAER